MIDQQQQGVQYSLGEKLSRCCTNLSHNKRHIFAIGTCCVKQQNQIHIIEYLEMDQKIEVIQVIDFPGIIEKLISNVKQEQIYVIYRDLNTKQMKFSCCQLQLNNSNSQPQKPQQIFELEYEGLTNIICHETDPVIYLANQKSIVQFDLNRQEFQTILEENEEMNLCEQDPYHSNLFVRSQGPNLCIIDSRERKFTKFIAHSLDILDIDFNPNKQYYLLSGGQDCNAKIWDIRKTHFATKSIEDLQNSVLQSKYNKFHDQLVSLAFDDGTISLYNLSSVSSVPQLSHIKEEDYLVRSYDEHEDHIYALCWSNTTAWIMGSVSYSGHLIINTVPTIEKYKILL